MSNKTSDEQNKGKGFTVSDKRAEVVKGRKHETGQNGKAENKPEKSQVSKPETKVETKPVVEKSEKPEAKSEAKSDAKQTEKSEVKQAVKTENKPAAKLESAKINDDNDELDDNDFTEIKLNSPKTPDNSSRVVRTPQKKKMSKKTKKIIRVIAIIAVIIAAIVIYFQYAAYKVFYESDLFKSTTEETVVERRDLQSTISTTGTIQSKDVRTITSALAGVTIDEVNCEVGDMVTEGQTIITFSRDDINERIAQIEQDIDKNQATQRLTEEYKAKEHAYDYGTAAYDNYTAATSTASAATTVARAQEDLDQACQDKSKYMDKYNEAVANIDELEKELTTVKGLYSTWKTTNLQEPLNQELWPNGFPYPSEEKYKAEKGKVDKYLGYFYSDDAWTEYITDLEVKVKEYQTTIDSYDSTIDSYNNRINSAQRNLADAQTNQDKAVASQNEAIRRSTNNLITSDYTYARDALTAGDNVTNLERQLSEQQDKLDNYQVTAPITGLVTSVNAQEGNGYQANTGSLVTIQAVDSYEVTTQIDEYDINRVQVGQEVAIMTDATGDDTLEGVVSFISPVTSSSSSSASTASMMGASTGSSSSTYEVKIDVLSKDERLKLGMSAKLNIITDSHDNVLAVRYDAIEEKDGGDLVVYVIGQEEVEPKNDAPTTSGGAILVVNVDGTAKVSGTPTPVKEENEDKKSDDKPERDKKGKKDEKPSFIKYLFSSKEDLDVLGSVAAKGNAKEVVITKGIEGDYYTEIISPEISEGTVLMVNSKNGAMQNIFMQMMGGDMGDMGPMMY